MSDQLFIQNYIYLDKNTYLTEMNSNTVSSYQSEHVSKNKFLDDYKVFYNNISPNEKIRWSWTNIMNIHPLIF